MAIGIKSLAQSKSYHGSDYSRKSQAYTLILHSLLEVVQIRSFQILHPQIQILKRYSFSRSSLQYNSPLNCSRSCDAP